MSGTRTAHGIPGTDQNTLSFAFFCFLNDSCDRVSDHWYFYRTIVTTPGDHSCAMTSSSENALKITILPEDAFCQIYLHEILSGILPLRYSVQGPSTILCCCPSRALRDLVPSLNLGTWLHSSFPRAAIHRLSSTGHEAPPATSSSPLPALLFAQG